MTALDNSMTAFDDTLASASATTGSTDPHEPRDVDPLETAEWLASLEAVHHQAGSRRVEFLLKRMHEWSMKRQVPIPYAANTPYINTIPRRQQPPYPGDRKIERRIKSFVRWNAMAMVVRANRKHDGIGGHISTYQSVATLFEVGFNHFFRAPHEEASGDHIFFQGHASPGVYARAYLERRINEDKLENFRRELAPGGGLSSYPHPWLMPGFWQFPTVSMGLGPLNSIYQARFNRYIEDRGLKRTAGSRIWAFLGDGEMDEPESLGAINLASREKLDNLTWIINCNLQRLDGPVRGNGNIVQELEAVFRGAGWNVIKVLWGSDWDPLFDRDTDGLLIEHMGQIVDGQWQRFTVESGAYARAHFFGRDPGLARLVDNLTDEQIRTLRLGGHDPDKVFAAFSAAVSTVGRPSVILARTIKGYGLGEAGEGKNITHQQKKLNEEELKAFRDRFDIPITDDKIDEAPFCRFEENSPEMKYMLERRAALGGALPRRRVHAVPMEIPALDIFDEFMEGSGDRKVATTMAVVRMINRLMSDKRMGKLIVPIVPDEARTFGMEALFRSFGIYAHSGQLYEPVDAHLLMRYEERKNGQILEEGITECGAMASFIAAGTAYSTHNLHTIPFFLFYSMFGFQRIGDSIWLAGDMRTKGFLIGATAGRTTLNGEGLQHQDGHSHLHASTVPNCLAYDCAFAYELAHVVHDGLRRMHEKGEDVFYYLTVYNETYAMPTKPAGCEAGILRGMYKFKAAENPGHQPRLHLFGSGPLINEALRAQEILHQRYAVAADVWSVTSYNELYREARACERWNRLHPTEPQRVPYITQQLAAEPWPVVTTSDWVSSIAQRLSPFTPRGMTILGTDGFGRSETRAALRRHFEIDAEHLACAGLAALAQQGQFDRRRLAEAITELGLDPEAVDPATA